jgi:hypothetical protein
MPERKPAGVRPHPLVEALVPDPAQPPLRTTKLFGYPGRSTQSDTTRVWLDLDLSAYVEVPNASIRYARELPDDGGTWLWVDADAPLQYASTTSQAAQAEFLTGTIAAGRLRAAPPAVADIGQTRFLCTFDASCGAATFPNRCPSHLCPPSQDVVCPSVQLCPPTADCPSRYTPCNTDPITCPPPATLRPGTCPSVNVQCVSLDIPCLTQNLPCPTKQSCPSVDLPCATQSIRCPSVVIRCPSQNIPCITRTTPCVSQFRCPSQDIPCITQLTICPSVGPPCPNTRFDCPSAVIICQSDLTICPTAICPSVAILCETTPGCPLPTRGCPGPDPGPFNPVA